jgi:two-component sensor histidine kinase
MSKIPVKSTVASLHQELSAAGAGLIGNADVLRGVLAGSGDCIKILDLKGNLQFMSEGGKHVMEVDDFASLKGCPWSDFWADVGNVEAKRAVEVAAAGGTARFKGQASTAKGTLRFWDVQVSPIMDGDGKPSHILSMSRDITEEWKAAQAAKEAAERQALLTAELQHRIKNTLAMVGAIANQTMRGNDVAAAREAFSARLMILSSAHDILTQTSWASAPIKEVIEGALAPHRAGHGQIYTTGPDLVLPSKQALALSVAIHELATNAVKYGALSGDGTVNIAWLNTVSPDRTEFRFTWSESNGLPVHEPEPSKKGFGSRLIERMLANDFAGTVRIEYRSTGLVCELTAPAIGQAL